MIEALWLISGVAGATLIWRQFKLIERHDPEFTWCPSPLGIFFLLAASIGGFILLGVGVLTTAAIAFENYDFKEGWLTRPICKHRTVRVSSTPRNTPTTNQGE